MAHADRMRRYMRKRRAANKAERPKRRCVVCDGALAEAKRLDAVYCSERCRARAARERRKQHANGD